MIKSICTVIAILFTVVNNPTKSPINYTTYYNEGYDYCKQNNLNTDFFILIDLGIHSGKKRFFVYDFNKKTTSNSYTVSHGCGDNEWGADETKENPKISNAFDSHCSSIGKYLITKRGVSQWGIGINYTLRGKDKTNSNAEKRAIVLHSWEEIPHQEVYPNGTPEGWGCPALSNQALRELDAILKTSKKSTLLWIIKT